MTSDGILLIGRADGNARQVYETHARRLETRTDVDHVEVATYESEPSRELRDQLRDLHCDEVYAVPMTTAQSHDTLQRVPGALAAIEGRVHYTEPVGRSPAVTQVILDRASDALDDADDTTLVLVGFGSSSKPYNRQTANYHAARIRENGPYDAVTTCYLLQNPTVECARYDVDTGDAVAVPLFVANSPATDERIPAELELDRGGVQYADPFGTHDRLTDAIVAQVHAQRALGATTDADVAVDVGAADAPQPVATDGDGRAR